MQPEEVYSTKFDSVYKFFYYKDVDADEIEDLTQETFLRFYQKYDPTQLEDTQIAKILYTIARNIWKEWLRGLSKNRTEELFDTVDYALPFEEFTDEIQDQDAWQHERGALISAIKECNPTMRSVLTLRFIEGKTRKEIAELLSIKEDHVYTYQKRGVKMLQKMASGAVPPQSHTK
jgi:RNA polymerase sigma factor (sigma-70 family)